MRMCWMIFATVDIIFFLYFFPIRGLVSFWSAGTPHCRVSYAGVILTPLVSVCVCVRYFRSNRSYLGENQKCKNDFYRFCYSHSYIVLFVLRDLDLHYEVKIFSISYKRWELKNASCDINWIWFLSSNGTTANVILGELDLLFTVIYFKC